MADEQEKAPTKWGVRESAGKVTERPALDLDGAPYDHSPTVIYRRLPENNKICVAIPPGKRATPDRMAALEQGYNETTAAVKTKPVPPLAQPTESK
jgi:predicted sugar kinase